MDIKLELSDFMYNAGIIGIMNILGYSGAGVSSEKNAIHFSSELLEKFSESYFGYMCEKYENSTSWFGIVNHSLPDINQIDEKKLEDLNKHIEFVKKTLQSNSYKNTYNLIKNAPYDIENLTLRLKKITKKKAETIKDVFPQINEAFDVLKNIVDYLKTPEAKKYIIARNVSYSIVQQFWEGVSFLHKKSNKKDMYEEFDNYFIVPIQKYLLEKQDEKKYSKYKYHCFTCENKFSKLGSAYELTWLNKTGVDPSRKSSHFWNYVSDAYICPLCNLVYACIPAGFTTVKGKGIFINQNESMDAIKTVNQFALYKDPNIQSIDDLEERSYFEILDIVSHAKDASAKKEIQNIQIIKLNSSTDSKHNNQRPYTFNVLSKEKLNIIAQNKKQLSFLVGKFAKEGKDYIPIYQEVTKRLYNDQSQFDLIYRLFKLFLQKLFYELPAIKAIIIINTSSDKGGKETMYYKEINKFQNYGKKLRDSYVRGDKEGKISGITYRLLNALKVNNAERFMDTFINAYMYQNDKIPYDFVQALQEDRFRTIGYAFLLGLQGEVTKDNEEENKKELSSNE